MAHGPITHERGDFREGIPARHWYAELDLWHFEILVFWNFLCPFQQQASGFLRSHRIVVLVRHTPPTLNGAPNLIRSHISLKIDANGQLNLSEAMDAQRPQATHATQDTFTARDVSIRGCPHAAVPVARPLGTI